MELIGLWVTRVTWRGIFEILDFLGYSIRTLTWGTTGVLAWLQYTTLMWTSQAFIDFLLIDGFFPNI
jgi:hypothetical protein